MIYIFKTSVVFKRQIKELAIELNKIKEIEKWNFDLEDCDKILRVEGKKVDTKIVEKLLISFEFECLELD
jgi:hypothetical protein